MSFTRDLVDGIYRQDKYSLVYLLLMANALSLAVFLSGDVSSKSDPVMINAGERENPAPSNSPPVERFLEEPIEKAQAAAAHGGVEVPVREQPVEQSQKDKVIDLEKVRSKPLVWRFPAN
ncbi:hypothetical protein [Thermosediminibacter litoriperuensis]|uniref:Uncharacterized protein n=1 Tax=Thermosediminibacter litoriperuensis TaxID=291989 RepID=A0A5S5AW66_9FIRM|nr:hypothetical protein [Thermosediminibacter litoriperuensis]TYP57598.1 hypothetical protein LZ11_00591 [Thermosediminibacter litoriperuensis]